MDSVIKEKWVKALRSGKYEQGRGYLCQKKDMFGEELCHCCLGVLCELSNLTTKTQGIPGHCSSFYSFNGLTGSLPTKVREEAKLTHDQETSLACMNDGIDAYGGNPQSFEQIANWIETNL